MPTKVYEAIASCISWTDSGVDEGGVVGVGRRHYAHRERYLFSFEPVGVTAAAVVVALVVMPHRPSDPRPHNSAKAVQRRIRCCGPGGSVHNKDGHMADVPLLAAC